ncbi:MAG: cardiolipin synthase [Actinobacteria bacterium]|nr:cardiolipin synthase [Actinomycetota bacterium]
MGWEVISSWPSIGVAVLLLYWAGVTVTVLTDDREPTATWAWLLVLVAFPLIGLPFYYLFGRDWKRRALKDPRLPVVRGLMAPTMERVRAKYASAQGEALAWANGHGVSHVVGMIAKTEGAVVLPAYDFELLIDGTAKFEALKRDLAAATDTVNIQYFAWERDKLTAELTEILLERLAAGVEVRMLNDFIGCLPYKKDEIRRLRAAGARILYDVVDPRQVNYRDHRKIVVIDGVLGYTGGLNVGQEYIDGAPRFPAWRDSHCRFHGPAVADLQRLFVGRWHARTGKSLFTERFFPTQYPEGGRRTLAQIVSTGVDVPWDPARRAHMAGMSAARERIWIQSPYLVPTPDILSTMLDAALGGIDVRFMMTAWPDKKIAYYAAESFFRQLVEAGVKVYRYKRGFFHPKTMTIDGQVLVIGTMNFDIRSLALDKELMVWLYDEELAAQHERVFLEDMAECELMTLEEIGSWSSLRRLRNSGARLASNLL